MTNILDCVYVFELRDKRSSQEGDNVLLGSWLDDITMTDNDCKASNLLADTVWGVSDTGAKVQSKNTLHTTNYTSYIGLNSFQKHWFVKTNFRSGKCETETVLCPKWE